MILYPEQIKEWAINAHKEVNHFYGNLPYEFHLSMVVGYYKKFKHLLPEKDYESVFASCWLHDTIEDCRKTYNDIFKIAGEEVADIVYALTNEKGKNRSERANEKYYAGIVNNRLAHFVKLCDRLSNMGHSVVTNGSMAKVYKLENKDFCSKLDSVRYEPMIKELEIMSNLV